MKNILKTLIIVLAIGVISCSDDASLENHLLVGDYIGSWETASGTEQRLSIEFEEKRNGLVLFFSLADSSDLNIISDTEFTIDRFEKNGYSNGISGIIVEDTLYMQNETFLVTDQMNTESIRTGKFAKQ